MRRSDFRFASFVPLSKAVLLSTELSLVCGSHLKGLWRESLPSLESLEQYTTDMVLKLWKNLQDQILRYI